MGTIEPQRVRVGRASKERARVVNGAIRHEGIDLQVSEESQRRLDGRLGAGGPMIRLETTNGGITVKGRD